MYFICSICQYNGAFDPIRGRLHAQCPRCLSLERHRLQFGLLSRILKVNKLQTKKMLHFAPEPALRSVFSTIFSNYETADLNRHDVDHCVDIQELPFANESYDVVFASHVLEHIKDDYKAIREIYRILKRSGIAVLPVPIIDFNTLEYKEPNPQEDYHVRAPGLDYFERYQIFSRVEIYTSSDLDEIYQPYLYSKEAEQSPFLDTKGRLNDFVPFCFK